MTTDPAPAAPPDVLDATTSGSAAPPPGDPDGRAPRLGWPAVRHYLEMVVAMLVGMALLGPLVGLVVPDDVRADVHTLLMATEMAAGMTAWMRYRGHSWSVTLEMDAAMYVPFLVLLPLYEVGWISATTLTDGGHLLMLVAMALAVLRRPEAYAHCA